MSHVISKDGTTIAYERSGNGPALILVDGALCSRAFGPTAKLGALLARHFTVYSTTAADAERAVTRRRIPRRERWTTSPR